MRLAVIAIMLLALPLVTAGTPDDPELTDPEGDATLRGQGGPTPPYADAVDLVGVWFQDDAEGLAIGIRVVDLAALDGVAAGQFQWAARFDTSYQNASGPAARIGTWTLKAYYVAGTGWGTMLERPCLDGDSTDGCAGNDRDITDATSLVDVEADTVWLFADWNAMGSPIVGDGIHSLHATAQAQVPSTSTAFEDWEMDETAQCHHFLLNGTLEVRAAGTTPAQAGASNGLNGRSGTIDETDVCAESRPLPSTSPPVPATNTTTESGPADNATTPAAPAEESPWPVGLTLVAVLTAWRRRLAA